MPLGARGRIIPAVAAPSAAGPNAPTLGVNGWTILRDTPFNVRPSSFVTYNEEDWRLVEENVQGTSGIVSDPTAPLSPPNVMEVRFPQGYPGGGGPYAAECRPWGTYRNLYVAQRFRMSANWSNSTNAGTKSNFVTMPGIPNPHYWGPDGQGTTTRMYWGQNRRSWSGFTDTVMPRGVWMLIEWLLIGESVAGITDGIVRGWLDGVPVAWVPQGSWGGNTNELHSFFEAGDTVGWNTIRLNSTYGGGNAPVPADQSFFHDHLFVMGSNQLYGGYR